MEISYLNVPEEIIDVEIGVEGNVYVLLPGLPHLIVYSSDGSMTEFDLSDILLPGGFCVDERWGWIVSDILSDRIYHFDNTGEPAEFWDTRSRPGDICISGLTVLYVSKTSGTICSVNESGEIFVRLEGVCDGQLSSSGNLAVYSSETESYLFEQYSTPQELPHQGIWALSGDELIVLDGKSISSIDSEELFQLPDSTVFRRISCSADGNRYVFWSHGRGEVLVLR